MMLPIKEQNKLEVYSETKRRKNFVGVLSFDPQNQLWEFRYDKDYLKGKTSIPLGPELSLKKQVHKSKKELFPSFADRIPLKANPAYADYCASQGISPNESNPIVLLTTIGKRGPSTFVFETILYENKRDVVEDLQKIAKQLKLSLWDIATAFDLFKLTVQRIMSGESRNKSILKLIEVYLTFPEVALWQLSRTSKKLPGETAGKLIEFFKTRRKTTFP